jgi:hypothetical protein
VEHGAHFLILHCPVPNPTRPIRNCKNITVPWNNLTLVLMSCLTLAACRFNFLLNSEESRMGIESAGAGTPGSLKRRRFTPPPPPPPLERSLLTRFLPFLG